MKIPISFLSLLLLAFVSNAQIYNLTSGIKYKTMGLGGKDYLFVISEVDTSSKSTFTIDLGKKIFTAIEKYKWQSGEEEILSVARNGNTLTLEVKPARRSEIVWRKYKVDLGNDNKVLAIHRSERNTGARFALDTIFTSYTNNAAHLSFYRKVIRAKTQASQTREVMTTTQDVRALFDTPFTPADFTFEIRNGIVRWTEGSGTGAKVHTAPLDQAWIIKTKDEEGVQYLWLEGDLTYSLECTNNTRIVDKNNQNVSKLIKMSTFVNKKMVATALMY